jgi:hypothetical protein
VKQPIVLALLAAAAAPVLGQECGADLPLRATAGNLSVAFGRADVGAAERGTLPAHRHFALELQVCPPLPLATIRVDADMPAHRHGMNYRTSVTALAQPGRFRAEGLLLHMAGRWRVIVDLPLPEGPLRLTQDIDVR